jgi:hypothetical protein
MSFPKRSLVTTFIAFAAGSIACHSDKSELEQHADACASLCKQTQSECSSDPAFAGTWELSCEVSCNLEFDDETHPLETCIDAADSCSTKNACLNGGPISTDDGAASEDDGADDAATAQSEAGDDDSDASSEDGGDSSDGGSEESSSGGEIIGNVCCDTSGAGCTDLEVQECTCLYMPECCTGSWNEACASVAVANGCIEGGCSTLEGQGEWDCSCSTTSVYCPDDPFVGQIIFGTDACGLTQADALAIVTVACEHGDGTCEIGAGSCECTCDSYGEICGPQ